jgi:alkylation response protein AidB-like acyl-CoA dehydrogenase
MQWELSEEQQAFQAAFRGWLERAASSELVRGWMDSGDTSDFEERLADEDWLAVGTPEELGGQGGGLVELAIAAEELGRSAAPSAAWLGAVLALPALATQPEVARAVLSGDSLTVLAVAAGRPTDQTSGIQVSGGRLTGSVSSVLGAGSAGHFVVPAHDDRGRGLYLVDASAPGVVVVARELLDRSRAVADVVLESVEGVRLDVDAREVLRVAALRAAVLVSADALGASERMLDLSVEYSKQRHQFGVPIGSFQAVKHAAAMMLVGVEAARSVVYFAAASVQEGHPEAPLHAAAAKAQVTAQAASAAESALTIHGAIGYTWEHDLQLFYKRAKLDQRLFGEPSKWNERIADALQLVPHS